MDAHRSPWEGGPDEQLLLRPGARPLSPLDDADGQRLAAHGINPLRAVRATLAAQLPLKTLELGSGAGAEGSLLTVRRRQLLAINSIEQGTRWARFAGRDRNTWPRLARQVHAFLLGLAGSGAFGKGADLQPCEVTCDERLHGEEELAAGIVHCLVALPTPRAGVYRSFLVTHRPDGSSVRRVTTRTLPPGTRFVVDEPVGRGPAVDPSLDETAPRRTLAQELFAPSPEARAPASGVVRPAEATAARRLDQELVARLHGDLAGR
jgi:hypothetical protein